MGNVMQTMKIGMVGLGLMGGSMAKAMKAFTPHTVYGYDISQDTMETALAEGAIDAPLTNDTLPVCDILLVGLYPQATIAYVQQNAHLISSKTVVIDLCGVKRTVQAALAKTAEDYGFTFMGGHPMAGVAKTGYANSFAEMFQGASMILTPTAHTPQEMQEKAERLFLSMGFGGITWSSPEEHDRIIAYTSQLAHVLSSAYVKSPTALTHTGFSAGSFKDMTRVAWLNETIWAELFLQNKDFLAEEIDGLVERLQTYAVALKQEDEQTLIQLLQDGKERKEHLSK